MMSSPAINAQGTSGDKTTTAGASPDLVDPDILKKASLTNVTDAELELPQPSWLQKHILLAAIRLVGKFRRHTGSCLTLTKDLCVKYGSRIYLVEAQSMIYVARHTTIPVPVVHLAFTHKGCTYILMERITGESKHSWTTCDRAEGVSPCPSRKIRISEATVGSATMIA
jgi:hypothetical protein